MGDSSDNDNVAALVSGAESLLSSVYGSTTFSNIATLTWPSTVVVNGATFTYPVTSTERSLITLTSSPSSAATSGAAASTTPAESTPTTSMAGVIAAQTATSASSSPTAGGSASSGMPTDKRLGIGLGIAFGLVALAIFFAVIFLLRRRKQKTGTYLRHHPAPEESEVESWRGPKSSWSTHGSTHEARIWSDKYAPLDNASSHSAVPDSPRPAMPALMRSYRGDNDPEHNWQTSPYAPAELAAARSSDHLPLNSNPTRYSGLSDTGTPRRSKSKSRSATPLMQVMANTDGPVRSISPPPQQNRLSQHQPLNPFMSPEDDEADHDHYYEPPVPPRSPQRRNSPQIHYPSEPEVSGFNFGLTDNQLRDLRHAGHNEPYGR